MTALPAGDHAFVVGIVLTRIGLLVVGTNQSAGADYGEHWQFLNGIEWQAAPTIGSPDSGVSFNAVLQAGDLLWVTGQTDQGAERVWSIAAQGP